MAKASQQYSSPGSCWDAVRSKILERKLGFLQRVLSAVSRCVSGRLVKSTSDSISSLCLVRECKELEELCGVAFTDKMLKGELVCGKNLKGEVGRMDGVQLLDRYDVQATLIAEVERRVGYGQDCGMQL